MALSSIYEETLILHLAYDSDDKVEYIGKARPSTADDTAGWDIKKIEYDSNDNIIEVLMASGNDLYDKKWSLRDTYSYS